MKTPYYITTPIYYVNADPHIGTAYTTFAADALARFMRLDGRPVYFLTGTDEHGQKVEKAAEDAGVTPQAYVDEVSARFQKMSETFEFTNDRFIRTTDAAHKAGAQAFWKELMARDQIYKGQYAGWYAVRDEAFYQEDEIVDGKAPTGAPVTWVEEECYFFKLSAWQEPLLKFYKENPECILPKSRYNEVVRFVEGGLKDLSISRSTFSWGIPVPDDPKHVMYVWVEALPNYITALGYPDTQGQQFQQFWPQAIHLVGKDILRFHAVYWPALLMAVGLTPPKHIFAHGWWTNEGQKISKSLGNVINPFELVSEFGLDQVRYYLLRQVPFGQDGDFSRTQMIQRINADLANDFGNLSQRVLSFIYKNCEGKIPEPQALLAPDQALLGAVAVLLEKVRVESEQLALHKMMEHLWAVMRLANQYIDEQAPWTLRKTDLGRMGTVLYVLAEAIRQLAILAQPFVPQGSKKILDQLMIPASERTFAFLEKPCLANRSIPEPQGVFPRF